jgi:hypothetical protein
VRKMTDVRWRGSFLFSSASNRGVISEVRLIAGSWPLGAVNIIRVLQTALLAGKTQLFSGVEPQEI